MFAPDVPTGTGAVAQAINLPLPTASTSPRSRRRRTISLSTVPGVNGRVKKIAIRKVSFHRFQPFGQRLPRLEAADRQPAQTYRLIIRGQSFGTLTIIFTKWKILSETQREVR